MNLQNGARPGKQSAACDLKSSNATSKHTLLCHFCMPSSKVLYCLFGTLLFSYLYVHQRHFDNAIPVSRLDLLHALFVQGAFTIDAYHHNTPDKSLSNGHYYCDKAPGIVFLAIGPFAFASALLASMKIPLDSESGWLLSSWIACAGSVAILAALGGVAMFLWLCNWFAPRLAYVCTIGVFLGATPFPYATML